MRFDYSGFVTSAPDTGEPTVIFRPEVSITIHGLNASGDFVGLVDTGADNTILPESVARSLGIPLIPGKGPAARAFGGQQIALSHADVELELIHPDGPLRWQSRVYFLTSDAHEETLILGQQGFLEYFTATFIGEECTLELSANSFLPTVSSKIA